MTTTRHFHIDWYVIVFSISLEEYIVQYRFDLWSHIYKKLDRLLDTQKVAGRGYRHTDIQDATLSFTITQIDWENHIAI